MKKIRIDRVIVDNFQSWKHRDISLGDVTTFKGINGAGKSTFEKIVKWVLLGIESKADDIRPHNSNGEYLDGNTKVTLEISVNDEKISLTKIRHYSSNGSKTTEYLTNDMPCSTEKEYKAFITQNLADLELLSLSMDINTFFSKSLADRRETLIKWIAPISNDEIVADNNNFDEIKESLKVGTVKQIEKKCNDEIKALKSKLADSNAQMQALQNLKFNIDFVQLEKDLDSLASKYSDEEIINIRFAITDLRNQFAEIEKQIGFCKTFKKVVAQKIADQQKTKDLILDFQKIQSEILEKKVNSHFNLCTWKLFEELVNGEVKDTCKCLVDGSDFEENLNTGHRILARLEILNAFQKVNGIETIMFLDDAESLDTDKLPKIDNQLIIMRHTDEDKELVIE